MHRVVGFVAVVRVGGSNVANLIVLTQYDGGGSGGRTIIVVYCIAALLCRKTEGNKKYW